MIVKIKNYELEARLMSLQPFLKRRDMLGYAAARNTRTFTETLTEYFNFKNDIARKYGKAETDSEGKPTGKVYIPSDDPNYEKVLKEINDISNIEHEVKFMTLDYVDVIENLSGEEILQIDWMLTD